MCTVLATPGGWCTLSTWLQASFRNTRAKLSLERVSSLCACLRWRPHLGVVGVMCAKPAFSLFVGSKKCILAMVIRSSTFSMLQICWQFWMIKRRKEFAQTRRAPRGVDWEICSFMTVNIEPWKGTAKQHVISVVSWITVCIFTVLIRAPLRHAMVPQNALVSPDFSYPYHKKIDKYKVSHFIDLIWCAVSLSPSM